MFFYGVGGRFRAILASFSFSVFLSEILYGEGPYRADIFPASLVNKALHDWKVKKEFDNDAVERNITNFKPAILGSPGKTEEKEIFQKKKTKRILFYESKFFYIAIGPLK